MIIIKQYSAKRRLVFGRISIYGWKYSLQEKRWYGWRNITSQYPSIMKGQTLEQLEKQLYFQEDEVKGAKEYKIGAEFLKANNII